MIQIGQAKRISISDVASVAFSDTPIVVISSSSNSLNSSKISNSVNFPNSSKAVTDDIFSIEDELYPECICRAILFCRSVSNLALQAPILGAEAAALVSFLNAGITPLIPIKGGDSIDKLCSDMILGKGSCRLAIGRANSSGSREYIELPISEAMAAVGIEPILPTAIPESEKPRSSFPAVSIAIGSLLAYGAQSLSKVVDCVAALTCEAIGFNKLETYDLTYFESSRPHRGIMLSASTLRLLLDGSKRCSVSTPNSPAVVFDASVFCRIPQINGPSIDSIAAACKVMDIELNSIESSQIVFDDTQTLLAASQLCDTLMRLIDSSSDRLQQLHLIVGTSVQATKKTSQPQSSLLQQYLVLMQLVSTLTAELSASLAVLDQLDTASTQKTAAVAEDAEGGSQGVQKGSKPEQDDSHLSEEQRLKAEAKRKAKADKAALKAQQKESKKSAALVLGAGSSLIRNHLKAQSALALRPFDDSEAGFVSTCERVVEQLNAGGKRRPKIPKGARDYTPEQMRIREQAFSAIRRVFKRHGGVEIDTPVFELKEVLTGKYGEDSKLIYHLADQGGELLSLRYDLTVPFARFLAMNSVGNIKRFHIAKVYRRDQPQLARGRYREFYQCDFDIAGAFSPMVADAEVISVAAEILSELPVGTFLIKLNHRKLLDAIFDISGVPVEKFRPICSAVDKLDKLAWAEVKAEMVEEKGLSAEVADKIGSFVLFNGQPQELWERLTADAVFGDHSLAAAAMADLKTLFAYLAAMNTLQHVSFDLSLARGLDYYTGVIYEAVLTDGTSQVGSIAAGGRYDNLVGMFSAAGVQTPCVGVSIGIERVFTIMEKKAEQLNILQSSNIQVYVASIGSDLICERMRVAQSLWAANIASEYSHLDNPKFKKQLDEALERGIPFMVVFGPEELEKGAVKVKNMSLKTEQEVVIDELVAVLLQQGCVSLSAGVDVSFITAMKASSLNIEVKEKDGK